MAVWLLSQHSRYRVSAKVSELTGWSGYKGTADCRTCCRQQGCWNSSRWIQVYLTNNYRSQGQSSKNPEE